MNKFLLDTHAIIWFIEGNEGISETAKNIIINYPELCKVSVLSLWEISIKFNVGKLKTKHNLQEFIELTQTYWTIDNNINNQSIIIYQKLPLHHRDPFDRMLIAQAKAENLTIITKDKNFSKYDVNILW